MLSFGCLQLDRDGATPDYPNLCQVCEKGRVNAMNNLFRNASKVLAAAAFVLTAGGSALADCQADIDKVERAIDHPERSDLDMGTEEQMRQILQTAVKEHRAGNEAKCQELINQAKYIGNVE